jgi:hypothetical protein
MAVPTDSLIDQGRAYIRIIQAIDLLMAEERRDDNQTAFTSAPAAAAARLERLVRGLDGAALAQILAASDKVWGIVPDIRLN